VNWRILYLPDADCQLTRTPVGGSGTAGSTNHFNLAHSDGGAWIKWGSSAPIGNYNVSVTCTIPGTSTKKTSAPVPFQWIAPPPPTTPPTLGSSPS
jgi:hypothetical protein